MYSQATTPLQPQQKNGDLLPGEFENKGLYPKKETGM